MYKGMRLVKLPTIRNKYLDTITHTFLSAVHGLRARYDVVAILIAGNSPTAILPRLVGQKVVVNVDGLDWKREKWPAPAKLYIQLAERLAPLLAHRVVTDSVWVQSYYRNEYGAKTDYIAYGSDIAGLPPGSTLERFGLEPRNYILFVGRLVPENGAHELIAAFNGLRVPKGLKLVIVGDAPYSESYIHSLRNMAGPEVVFTGYVFGEGYRELGANAYAFVVSSGVGGTHPVLVEAMALGNCVVANDSPSNVEVVGDAAVPYDGKAGPADLREKLQFLVDHPSVVETYRQKGTQRANTCYKWDRITDQYEGLFLSLLSKEGR
jgi:glycosyltransferase involved in cell wall biosynthesis